jgi:hypothetical protein
MHANTTQILQAARIPTTPHPDMSERYQFLNTGEVIDAMRDQGFLVANISRPQTRTPNGPFGLHQVDFRQERYLGKAVENTPRFLFTNSYDGSKRAAIMAGIFRLVCSNGLVVGDTIAKESALHVGDQVANLLKVVMETVKKADNIFGAISDMSDAKIDRPGQIEFAAKAAALRFGERPILDVEPEMILMPRRREDAGDDMWRVFNRVQENLMKGDLPGKKIDGSWGNSRPLSQILKGDSFNRQLWDLATETAKVYA